MKWAIPLMALGLGATAAAKPAPHFNERAVYEILKSHVAAVDEPFDLFHWEPAESAFAGRFKSDFRGNPGLDAAASVEL